MKQLIERLRQLEAAATPGPWFYTDRFVKEKDCRLIAEMRNAVPQLLDRLEKLERVAEATKRLRSGLEITNHHIRRDGTVEIRLANITDNQSVIEAMDALTALEGK